MKFDASVNVLWVDTYSNGNAITVKTDMPGNIYTLTPYGSLANGNIRISKFNANGERLWSNSIEGSAISQRLDVTIDEQSNVYQLIEQESTTNGMDVRITKFDKDGVELWSEVYGGNNDESGLAIEIWNDLLIVAGTTGSTNGEIVSENGNRDGFLVIVDYNGVFINSHFLGGSGNDQLEDVKVVNGQIYISGLTNSVDDGFDAPFGVSFDVFFAGVDGNGALKWIEYSGGSNTDIDSQLDIVNDSMIVVGYSSYSQDGSLERVYDEPCIYVAYYDFDYTKVHTSNISEMEISISPNPTTGEIWIKEYYDLEYIVCVEDMNGRKLITKCLTDGKSIELLHFASGIYTVSLIRNGIVVATDVVSNF